MQCCLCKCSCGLCRPGGGRAGKLIDLGCEEEAKGGHLQQIVREISVEDTASYRNLMRIDAAKFRQLAEIIAPGVSKKPIVMRTPISVLHRLALTLRYLTTGESFRSLAGFRS